MIRNLAIIKLILALSPMHAWGGELFDQPENWIQPLVEVPEGMGFQAFEKYLSPDESIQVSIIHRSPVSSNKDKIDSLGGMISGMKNKGFKHASTETLQFRGHDTRRVHGKYIFDGYEGEYVADAYLIFTEKSTVIISITVDGQHADTETTSDLLKRVVLDASNSKPSAVDETSRSYQIGEKVGYYGFFVVVGAAVIFMIIRNRKQGQRVDDPK